MYELHSVTRQSEATEYNNEVCYFCDMPGDQKNPLYLVQSFHFDHRAQQCAEVLDGIILQAKLQQGVIISQDVLYHEKCVIGLNKKAVERQKIGIAFCKILHLQKRYSINLRKLFDYLSYQILIRCPVRLWSHWDYNLKTEFSVFDLHSGFQFSLKT